MDEIARLRDKIDRIDEEILFRLKARSETATYIGQVKRAKGLPIRAHDREREILTGVQHEASKLGLNPVYARSVFQNILKLGVDAQQETHTPILTGLQSVVIGGTGGMGRLFVQLLKTQGAQVRIVGPTRGSTSRIASQLGVDTGRIETAGESDLVIVSVPLQTTMKIARKTALVMRPGSLLTDISSVKIGITNQISASVPRGVEYVSLHPLFGPQALTLHGQTMLFLPYRIGPTWQRLSRAFKRLGLTLSKTTAEKHDQTMAYVQAMHHFALISLGASLAKRWNGEYSTNALKLTLERVRVLSENRPTVKAIQEFNPYAARAKGDFLSTARQVGAPDLKELRKALNSFPAHVQKWSRKR